MNDPRLLGTLAVENEALLTFSFGMSDSQVEQLIHYATEDEAVKKFTSDPARFSDKESFRTWLQQGRVIYSLSDPAGNLAGVIWFGAKVMPQKTFLDSFREDYYGVTFSIRLYGDWRGKHLAGRFSTMAFAEYFRSPEYAQEPQKGIWLETSEDNIPAVVAYENFGFRRISEPDEHNKILMIGDIHSLSVTSA
jgi:ribosomal protein S18 acetylase RimI-like enzyme